MLNFLFWNVRGRDATAHITALIDEHAVDVVVLAEPPRSPQLRSRAGFHVPSTADDRCLVAVRRARCELRPLESYSHYTFYRLDGATHPSLTLVAVHAPSKLFYSAADQLAFACDLRLDLGAVERRQQHQRTVVVGDFNMDPFEPAMVGTTGLHAVLGRDIAERGARTVAGRRHDFFFNPMWSLMGRPALPGSYFYRGARPIEYFWHTFDQVLLRPALLPAWTDGDARIISTTTLGSLLTAKRRPDGERLSDHLPLLFRLRVRTS